MNWYLMVLKRYAEFNGRSRRKEYWMFVLFNAIIQYALMGILALISAKLIMLVYLYVLAVLLPSLGVAIRRMHDVGKSGWFILIPFYNLYLACLDSEPGTNEYGPNPKNPDEINEIGSGM